MEGKSTGYENKGMDDELDGVTPRARSGSRNYRDEDTRSLGSHRVVIMDVSDLVGKQMSPKSDELDYELRSYHGTPRISRSRRSSFTAPDIDCPEEDLNDDDKSDAKEEEGKKPDDLGDTNSLFSRRMTIAGGFLDVALFTSNCEQMKSILEIKDVHIHYELVLGLLIASLILQAISGLTLFMVGCVVIRHPRDKRRTEILNHVTIGIIVLITAINIFISSFTVKGEVLHRCSDCLKNNA